MNQLNGIILLLVAVITLIAPGRFKEIKEAIGSNTAYMMLAGVAMMVLIVLVGYLEPAPDSPMAHFWQWFDGGNK